MSFRLYVSPEVPREVEGPSAKQIEAMACDKSYLQNLLLGMSSSHFHMGDERMFCLLYLSELATKEGDQVKFD